MKAVYKEPMKQPEIIDVGNSLTALQHKVQGYIETVVMTHGMVMLCNEEGKLRGMPINFTYKGDPIAGPVLFVGTDGDQFCDLEYPEQWCEMLEARLCMK